MRAEYREGERFSRLEFTEETFYDCDFSDCTFIDCTFENCKLDHSVLSECQFIRCTITGLKTHDVPRKVYGVSKLHPQQYRLDVPAGGRLVCRPD